MMAVIIEFCKEFGLNVSKKKTETMFMPARGEELDKLEVSAAGQEHTHIEQRGCAPWKLHHRETEPHHGGCNPALTPNITSWCFTLQEGASYYDRPSVPLGLKIRMLKADVIDTFLYGCIAWTTLNHSSQLRTAHDLMLVRVTRSRRCHQTKHSVP